MFGVKIDFYLAWYYTSWYSISNLLLTFTRNISHYFFLNNKHPKGKFVWPGKGNFCWTLFIIFEQNKYSRYVSILHCGNFKWMILLFLDIQMDNQLCTESEHHFPWWIETFYCNPTWFLSNKIASLGSLICFSSNIKAHKKCQKHFPHLRDAFLCKSLFEMFSLTEC